MQKNKQRRITDKKDTSEIDFQILFSPFFSLLTPLLPLLLTQTHTPLLILCSHFGVHPALINYYFCGSYQTSAHKKVSGVLREWYHLLKGFGPAVVSSIVPRHRATAAWMGLRDLARPR